MPRKPETSRQQALEQIKRLIEMHPNGIKESEVVDKLNYNRRTANNYKRCPSPSLSTCTKSMRIMPGYANNHRYRSPQ